MRTFRAVVAPQSDEKIVALTFGRVDCGDKRGFRKFVQGDCSAPFMHSAPERNIIGKRLAIRNHIGINLFFARGIFPSPQREIIGHRHFVFMFYEHIRPCFGFKPVLFGKFAHLFRMAGKDLRRVFISVQFAVFSARHHERFIHTDIHAASPETAFNGIEKSVYKPINARFVH